MDKVIILHGTLGSSNSNWFQWLKSELEEKGKEVWVPDLPRPELPSIAEWVDFIFDKCPFEIDDNTLLVGHSAGAVAVLFVAQRTMVGKLISVASFKDVEYLQNELNFHANDRFFDIDFDFEAIKRDCTDITFVHSDNDPYCPLDHAEYLAEQTGGRLEVIPGQKHFNLEASPDYEQFPKLLGYQ